MIKLETNIFDIPEIHESVSQKASTNNDELFNTSFEMSLRLLLLTSGAPDMYFSSMRLLALDFISCYAKSFDLLSQNLHGNNDFMYGEIAGRQSLVAEAIKRLVRQDLLEVRINQGYLYKITDYGVQISRKFNSAYAIYYYKAAVLAIKKYNHKSDEALLNEIQNRPIVNLKG